MRPTLTSRPTTLDFHCKGRIMRACPMLLAASLLLTLPSTASAFDVHHWTATAGGSTADPANWSNGTPDHDDAIVFDIGTIAGPVTLEPNDNGLVVQSFVVTSGAVTLVPAPALLTHSVVGTSSSHFPIVTVRPDPAGSLWGGDRCDVGSAPGTSAWLRFEGDGAAPFFVGSETVAVGGAGFGLLDIEGSTVATGKIVVGEQATGAGVATISNGAVARNLCVGHAGSGTALVRDGAMLAGSSSAISIGVEAGSFGSLEIETGDCSVESGTLDIGIRGYGEMIVRDGAAFDVDHLSLGLSSHGAPQSEYGIGHLRLDGATIALVQQDVQLSLLGIGRIELADGAMLDVGVDLHVGLDGAILVELSENHYSDDAAVTVTRADSTDFEVVLTDRYVPDIDTEIILMEGFKLDPASVALPPLPADRTWEIIETGQRLSVRVAPLGFADLNRDGGVDLDDLLALLASWGDCSGCAADLDANGTVDSSDLLIFLGAWTN